MRLQRRVEIEVSRNRTTHDEDLQIREFLRQLVIIVHAFGYAGRKLTQLLDRQRNAVYQLLVAGAFSVVLVVKALHDLEHHRP